MPASETSISAGAAMLTIDDMAVSFGAVPILHGVDLNVRSHEIVGLVGRNGAGKTTFVRALMGLIPARRGRISLDAADLSRLPAFARARAGLGYVPQGRMIFPDLTVEDHLVLGAELDSDAGRDNIRRALQEFPRLAERLGQRGGTLSGGEQQMLAIARALVGSPKVLLLDEPTAGIQPSIMEELVLRLRAFSVDKRLTTLLIEQNADVVAALAHRVYVMGSGRIVAEIAPEELHDEELVRRYLAI
jgi:branched-chain amino acid transport system ATP-binding protein